MRRSTGSSGTEVAIVLLLAGLLIALLFAMAIPVFAASGMMGVGRMMGPGSDGGGVPGGGFAITTESGSPITTESNSILVTENAP